MKRSIRAEVLRTARAAPHLTGSEIAHKIGCHPDTVRKHLCRPPGWVHYTQRNREARHSDWQHRRRVAETAPPRLSRRFSADPSEHVRTTAARTQRHSGVLARLARDPQLRVRAMAARNPAIPQPLLPLLADESSRDLRRHVAENPNCPQRVLLRLAASHDAMIWGAVAGRPDLPREVVAVLAEHPDRGARRIAARHPRCPRRMRRRLRSDPDLLTAASARSYRAW